MRVPSLAPARRFRSAAPGVGLAVLIMALVGCSTPTPQGVAPSTPVASSSATSGDFAGLINVNGRNIRFVFDQNKTAHTIPRQKVKIAYTLSSSSDPNMVRINRFEVTLENGIKYVFGGTTESVEERKIEKFVIKTSFKYTEAESCPYTPYPPPSNPPPQPPSAPPPP